MNLSDIANLVGLAGTATAALKTGTETVQSVKELVSRKDPDLLALKKLVCDLYEELIVAKKAQMLQQEALVDLQRQAKKAKAFQAEKPRYVLTRTELGGILYALRPEEARGEAPHDLCPGCFQDEVKSVLQPVDHNTLGCSRCATRVFKPDGRGSGILIGRVNRPDVDGFI